MHIRTRMKKRRRLERMTLRLATQKRRFVLLHHQRFSRFITSFDIDLHGSNVPIVSFYMSVRAYTIAHVGI